VRPEAVDVVVVGGGPAGAVSATLLARLGHEVILLERAPRWRWRACGVFASPATVTALRRVGLTDGDLAQVARPVSAMRVETRRGTRFHLTYGGSGLLTDSAVGFDRSVLDPQLLAIARTAGVDVREGSAASAHQLDPHRATALVRVAPGFDIEARVVIGADGLRSQFARAAGVSRRAPLGARAALTFHIPDTERQSDARMVVIDDGYVGLAPVPGDRLNVGIVLGRSWFERLRRDGALSIARQILARVLEPPELAAGEVRILDRVAGVMPVGHAVRRRAGASWLLVGDAAGFLDPFTGEGLHRAIVSAELAAKAIDAVLAGRPGARLEDYDRAMRARFGTKDLVSRLVQLFLGRPVLFEYAARRLAARERVRETMGLVIGDLAPAARALDPRYLAALLAP
jgi:flavin-dependent dehydrogenase